MRPRTACTVCALLPIFAAPRVAADPAPLIALEYHAPEPCPKEGEFLAYLRARTTRFRLVDGPGKGVTTYRVTLASRPAPSEGSGETQAAGTAFRGRLRILDRGRTVGVRDLGGDTCQHVAEALSLLVALGIDVSATTGPIVVSDSEPPEAPEPVATEREEVPETSAASEEAPPARVRLQGAGIVGIAAVGGASPRILASPTATLEAIGDWHAPTDGVRPVLGLRASFARGATSASGVGTESAAFTWTAGRLDLCPVDATLGPLDALGCIGAELGVLDADGRGVTTRNDVVSPWFAVGPVVRLRATLRRPFFVEVDVLAMAPVLRERVYFYRPFADVYDVPALAGRVALGAGVRFP